MNTDKDINKYFIKLYVISLGLCFLTTFVLSPTTYPILGFLVGNGRFDDWWNTIPYVLKYPENTEYICTIPWVFIAFIKVGGSYLGILSFYLLFICIGIYILVKPYLILVSKYGRLYSFFIIFTYPILFSFWRGNSDFLIYGIVLASYIFWIEGKKNYSIIMSGLGIMFKPYQIFYILIYKLKEIKARLPLIVFGFLSSLGLIYLGDNNFFTTSWRFLTQCGENYTKIYIIGEAGSLHNNSIWGLFKFLLYTMEDSSEARAEIISNFSFYIKFWPVILVFTYILSRNKFIIFNEDRENFSSHFFLISLLVATLSPITPDYRLFLIGISLIILLLNQLKFRIILPLILLILLPKEFLWVKIDDVSFTINGPINAMLMIFIYLYVMSKNIFLKK